MSMIVYEQSLEAEMLKLILAMGLRGFAAARPHRQVILLDNPHRVNLTKDNFEVVGQKIDMNMDTRTKYVKCLKSCGI